MPTPQQQEALYQEGRIELAINAHKQDKSTSFRVIANAYDVPRSTAQDRARGMLSRRDSIANRRRLTPAQEESVKIKMVGDRQSQDDILYPLYRYKQTAYPSKRGESPVYPIVPRFCAGWPRCGPIGLGSVQLRRSTSSGPRLGPDQPNPLWAATAVIVTESLKQWILSMDQRGMPPRIATVQQIATCYGFAH
jgi:hypothetical protein